MNTFGTYIHVIRVLKWRRQVCLFVFVSGTLMLYISDCLGCYLDFVTKISKSPKFFKIQTFGFHSITTFEGSTLVEFFIFWMFHRVKRCLPPKFCITCACEHRLPHSSAAHSKEHRKTILVKIWGEAPEGILHGALLC